MNNKKNYMDANDEIKVNEEVKSKIFKNVLNYSENKSKRIVLKLMSCTAVFLIIFFGLWLSLNNKDNIEPDTQIINENNKEKITELSTVGTLENLYTILGKVNSNNYIMKSIDGINLTEATIVDSAKSNEAQTQTFEDSTDYSKTNVQVDGVDEADIVKTDGKYIYYIQESKIIIVDAKEPNNLKIVKEIKYDKETILLKELFVKDDKIIVIANKYIKEESENEYNYYNYKNYVIAIIYKFENEEITELRQIEIEGNYISTRMIGDNIYLLANKYIYYYNDENENKDQDILPVYRDTAVNAEKISVMPENIYCFPVTIDKSFLNIAGFNISNNEKADITSYLGAGQEVYCSGENLYVTIQDSTYQNGIFGFSSGYTYDTNIYKFKLDNGKVEFKVNGKVDGYIINQFAMDENDNYFRIATTDTTSLTKENANNLYILDEQLNVVGKVENLALNEKIYSVRFMDKKAYIVTFRQTDPLFVIDLSDVTAPKVLGELKIPGFSEYLHPYDENHIIGFGNETEVVNYEYGEVVKTTGMKMALFDVTDPSNPKQMYSVKIGDQGTYSELLDNHKALLFSKEKNIIAFPISISEDANNYRNNLNYQGAIIYGLSLENGFELKAKIAHMEIQNGYRDYDYTKEVERILYINDNLFTISKGLIKVINMETFNEVSKLEIPVEENKYDYITNIIT